LFAERISCRDVVQPIAPAGHAHVFNQYVIRTPDRDHLRRHLEQRGIGTEIYYPVPLHLQPCFQSLGYHRGDFPNAERAAAESLALPIFPELTDGQQQLVVNAVAEYFGSTAGEGGVGREPAPAAPESRPASDDATGGADVTAAYQRKQVSA
jgi:dTDP-4-amino-4,6-dideoxygalactose transaminase